MGYFSSSLDNLRAEWWSLRRFQPSRPPEPPAVRALLGAILLAALAVRALQAWRGLPYLHSWDEPFTVSNALAMLKEGRLDPRYFVYGSLPIYASMAVSTLHYIFLMGRPETSPPFLSSLDRITTFHDTGWFWEISHPSFYLWNRWLAALVGAATVLLVYLIARRLAGHWAAVAASAFLAFLHFHVLQSSIATVDNPMTFFVVLAAWAALAAVDERRPSLVILSLAACGLATSCKYTAILSVLMPGLALAFLSPGMEPPRRRALWWAVPVIPVLAFLAGTPYALLNLRKFLIDTGTAVRVYQANPLAESRVSPGVDHLLLQGGRMVHFLGVTATILALAGLAVLATRRRGWILVLYALAHALLIATSRLGYHRNFLVLYPLAAVAFGIGAVLILRALRGAAAGWKGRMRHVPAAAVLAVIAFLGWSAAVDLAAGVRQAVTPETRTEAAGLIRRVVEEDPSARIAVPEAARLHPDDLRGLEANVITGAWPDLLCRQEEFGHILAPVRWSAYEEENRPTAAFYAEIQPAGALSREWTAGVAPLLLDILSLDPLMELLHFPSRPEERTSPCLADLPAAGLEAGEESWEVIPSGEMAMYTNGTARSGWVIAGPGRHVAVVRAWGTEGDGEPARIRIRVFMMDDEGGELPLAGEEFALERKAGDRVVPFDVPGGGLVSVRVEFFNDWWDPVKRKGRDVYLQRVRIFEATGTPAAG